VRARFISIELDPIFAMKGILSSIILAANALLFRIKALASIF
jgi:hypothetical protein